MTVRILLVVMPDFIIFKKIIHMTEKTDISTAVCMIGQHRTWTSREVNVKLISTLNTSQVQPCHTAS